MIVSYPSFANAQVQIAVKTAEEFTSSHPGALDVIKWVLFDDNTYEIYRGEIGARRVQ